MCCELICGENEHWFGLKKLISCNRTFTCILDIIVESVDEIQDVNFSSRDKDALCFKVSQISPDESIILLIRNLTLGKHTFFHLKRTLCADWTLCTFWLYAISNIPIRLVWKNFEMYFKQRRINWCSKKVSSKLYTESKLLWKKMIYKKQNFVKKRNKNFFFLIF